MAYKNLVQHLKLAIRQLEQLTKPCRQGRVARICRQSFISDPDRFRELGIPGFMKKSEIVATNHPKGAPSLSATLTAFATKTQKAGQDKPGSGTL